MNPRRGVVIAGGGTGGHVVPGLTITRALIRRGVPAGDLHWIGSSRGMEVVDVPAAGIELTVLPGRGIERKLTPANIRNLFDIARAVPRAVRVLRRLRPGVVVSLGGYAAVPASVGAWLLRIPIVIQEQNANPSLANRLVSRRARHAAVAIAGTGLRNEVVTGNPLREEIVAARGLEANAAKERLGVPTDRPLVLCFGGSLGSRRINLATLDAADNWRSRTDISVRHVIGTRDWESVQPRIRSLAVEALHYEAVEYESDMATWLAAADVAVCRSGGMTVSELAALGVPAVLVPLPIAPNDAQRHNAAALERAGAAVVVTDAELDGARLATEVERMLADPSSLERRSEAAASLGRPTADEDIASLILGCLDD